MAQQEKKKPNILIIWGDDIGWFNISAYNHGIMNSTSGPTAWARPSAWPAKPAGFQLYSLRIPTSRAATQRYPNSSTWPKMG